MQSLSPQVLDIISIEYKTLIQSARGLVQRLTVPRLEELQAQLNELRGAAHIAQLDGMRRLFGEMLEALSTVFDGEKEIEDLQPLLEQGLKLAEGLIELIVDQKEENPCVLLAEMTSLRRFRGATPLYEYHLLNNVTWPSFGSLAQGEAVIGPQTEDVKRLHHLYQLGLLDIIRNNNRQKALFNLFRVAGRLQRSSLSERESNYWWVFSCIIKGFAEKRLSLQPERIRLLAAVEKQLRILVSSSDAARNPYPEGLWRAFVSLLAMTEMSSDARARKIGVPCLDFSDSAISAMRGIVTGEADSDRGVFDNISMSAAGLRALLDKADEPSSWLNDEQMDELKVGFETLAEECSSAGFHGLARKYTDFIASVSESDGLTLPVGILSEFTDAILHIECAMVDFHGKTPLPEQIKAWEAKPLMEILQGSLLKTAQVAVINETVARLNDIKQLVDNVASGYASSEVTPELELAFNDIEGSATMLNMTRLSDLARRCLQLVKDTLFGGNGEVDNKALEAFADTVICLEYFLDGCMMSDVIDEQSLDLAEECLATLGA